MPSVRNLTSPPYLFQPLQLFRRVWREYVLHDRVQGQVQLPWGVPITVNPRETIGRAIWAQGVYDLVVTELVWRLVDPGDLTVDVGANIGYVTAALGVRVGKTGRVHSFEPHPVLARQFRANLENWIQHSEFGEVVAHEFALSNQNSAATLEIPDDFSGNEGTARLASAPSTSGNRCFTVRTRRLEDFLDEPGEISLIKVDVEGHELEVFEGMGSLLAERRVRDILFEEHAPFPAETHKLLQLMGYTIFCFETHLGGLRTVIPSPGYTQIPGQPPNWLATKDSQRLFRRMKARGWRSFGVGRFLPKSL
jgi:FkbM family methyltransferase